jgi:hypothetical protein
LVTWTDKKLSLRAKGHIDQRMNERNDRNVTILVSPQRDIHSDLSKRRNTPRLRVDGGGFEHLSRWSSATGKMQKPPGMGKVERLDAETVRVARANFRKIPKTFFEQPCAGLRPRPFKAGFCTRILLQPLKAGYGTKRRFAAVPMFDRYWRECVAKLDCSWRSGSAVNFGRALVQLSR